MTIGQLRAILAHYSDELPVIIITPSEWAHEPKERNIKEKYRHVGPRSPLSHIALLEEDGLAFDYQDKKWFMPPSSDVVPVLAIKV